MRKNHRLNKVVFGILTRYRWKVYNFSRQTIPVEIVEFQLAPKQAGSTTRDYGNATALGDNQFTSAVGAAPVSFATTPPWALILWSQVVVRQRVRASRSRWPAIPLLVSVLGFWHFFLWVPKRLGLRSTAGSVAKACSSPPTSRATNTRPRSQKQRWQRFRPRAGGSSFARIDFSGSTRGAWRNGTYSSACRRSATTARCSSSERSSVIIVR